MMKMVRHHINHLITKITVPDVYSAGECPVPEYSPAESVNNFFFQHHANHFITQITVQTSTSLQSVV